MTENEAEAEAFKTHKLHKNPSRILSGGVLQSEALVPGGVEAAFDGLGLLFALALGIWDQFEFDVRV